MSKLAYTVEEAATDSGQTTAQIREAIRDGYLSARVSGERLTILSADLQRYLASLPSIHQVSSKAKADDAEAAKLTQAKASRERGRQIALTALGRKT